MWYWVCRGHGNTKDVFSTLCACRTRLQAIIMLTKEYLFGKAIETNDKLFIRKDVAHPDRDYKQHACPECGNLMSNREIDDTWDWAGPHCNNCGCTGLDMFVAVHEPIESGRSFLNLTGKEILNKWTS